MPPVPITLQAPNGARSSASAEIIRCSQQGRVLRAAACVIGGLIGGTLCIVIPIVHLFTTWGIPLLGVLFAVRIMRREVVVDRVEGPCPACGTAIHAFDRGREDPTTQVCPHCEATLRIVE